MATMLDKTKYDIQLNDVPYRVRSYQRTEVSPFIPRLSSGDQAESEFDLLRSKTITFEGGTIQRKDKDNNMSYAMENVINRYLDGVLYPAKTWTSGGIGVGSLSDKGKLTCIGDTASFLFGVSKYGSTSYVALMNRDAQPLSSTATSAAITGTINSIIEWGGYYWASVGTTNFYRLTSNLSATTAITGSALAMTFVVNFNGTIYGTDGSYLYRYTGTTGTTAWDQVATLPVNSFGSTLEYFSMFVYNNRIFIGRDDGFFAFDGIKLVVIEQNRPEMHRDNYRLFTVMRGYLYYFMDDGLYRFNGSLIEKLYDLNELGHAIDMRQYLNRLWILFGNSDYYNTAKYDAGMGYNYDSTTTIGGRVMVFDGVGLFTYGRLPTLTRNSGTEDFVGQHEAHKIIPYGTDINEFVAVSTLNPQNGFSHYTSASTRASIDIVTSVFDGGFPQITKELEKLNLIFDGTVAADTYTVKYRVAGFDASAAWVTIGTLTASAPTLVVADNLPAGITYDKIQLRVTGTPTADYGLERFVHRYTLQPDFKFQWSFTALCYGDDEFAPLQLADLVDGSQLVDLLRGSIYNSRDSDVPVVYLDTDTLVLSGTHNASTTTLNVDSTSIIRGSTGYLQAGTEIMRFTAKTSTTLTVVRGVLGSTAITHVDDEVAHLAYRVIVRTIQNERIELSDESIVTGSARNRDSEITLLLQEV
jgi:hypothetical protein